jgi:DNA polymerase V
LGQIPSSNSLISPSAPTAKLWALIDCNSFYCSCERIFRPDLAGQPVAVLSNNDGCLVAMTPETKALGFKMGDPYFKEAENLKRLGVAVFSSNYALYGDISRRVMSCLRTVVPDIHQYSIDEAFIPLNTALAAQAEEVGWELSRKTLAWVGVPTRVGLGPTRTMAKLANHWAKKKGRVFRLQASTDEYSEILTQTPLGDVWGIGRRLTQKLERLGLKTAWDLSRLRLSEAKRLLTVKGLKTVLELNGVQAIEDDLCPVAPKSLVSSRSFGTKVIEPGPLMESLISHCETVGARLREEGLLTPVLSIFIGTVHFIENPFSSGAEVRLSSPTNYTPTLIKAARQALDNCYRQGFQYARAGVMVFDLRSEKGQTPSLWDEAPSASQGKLMAALDQINQRYGRNTIRFAGQGDLDAPWRMRRRRMSPVSTTDWSGLPIVKA